MGYTSGAQRNHRHMGHMGSRLVLAVDGMSVRSVALGVAVTLNCGGSIGQNGVVLPFPRGALGQARVIRGPECGKDWAEGVHGSRHRV